MVDGGKDPSHNRENNMIWVALLATFCAGVVFGSLQGYRLIELNRAEAWRNGYRIGESEAVSTIANGVGDLWTEDELLQMLEDSYE